MRLLAPPVLALPVLAVTVLAVTVVLAGCAHPAPRHGPLSTAPPGLDIARAALASGAPAIALKLSTDRLRQQPQNVAALLIQGDALTALDRGDAAADVYRHVLTLQPGSPAARLGLGRLALASDPAGAEALFLAVLAREPRNAAALNDLGIARDLQGRHRQAQDAYRRALGVAPDMQAATVNLSLSLAMTGQAQQGLALLRPLAAAADVTPRVRQDYAIVSELAGDHAAAVAALGHDLSPEEVSRMLSALPPLAAPAQ